MDEDKKKDVEKSLNRINEEIIFVKKKIQHLEEDAEFNKKQQQKCQQILDELLLDFGKSDNSRKLDSLNNNLSEEFKSMRNIFKDKNDEYEDELKKLNKEKDRIKNMKEE